MRKIPFRACPLRLRSCRQPFQPICLCFGFVEQGLPIIERMPVSQHLVEYSVRVLTALVRPLGIFIIHPSVDDDFTFRVVAEEQTVLLKKLGAKPMLVCLTEGVALPVLGALRVLRNDLKGQFGDGRETLASVFTQVADGVFLAQGFDLLDHGFEGIKKQGVGEICPAVDHQRHAK